MTSFRDRNKKSQAD